MHFACSRLPPDPCSNRIQWLTFRRTPRLTSGSQCLGRSKKRRRRAPKLEILPRGRGEQPWTVSTPSDTTDVLSGMSSMNKLRFRGLAPTGFPCRFRALLCVPQHHPTISVGRCQHAITGRSPRNMSDAATSTPWPAQIAEWSSKLPCVPSLHVTISASCGQLA
mmetsp:Transcript_21630/g.30478  ORF Transcript_21630/g.30478 Transcript_21630/m.30478 type:complete len:164 (+) Transcript_21630:130-621(+)